VASSLHFTQPELGRWDALVVDAAAVAFFEDERPLRGAAGLLDWRLCGRVSRWLSAGVLSGRAGESVLTTAPEKLPFQRLYFYGLGPMQGFDERRYRVALKAMRDALWLMGARKSMLSPPGRDVGLIAPRRALELLQEEAEEAGRIDEVLICDSGAAQKEMAEALQRPRKKEHGRAGTQ